MVFEEFGGGEVADSREDDFVCAMDGGWIVGTGGIGAHCAQGFHDGGEVAGFVVDDGDHNNPLVLGSILLSCGSREQAKRRARA